MQSECILRKREKALDKLQQNAQNLGVFLEKTQCEKLRVLAALIRKWNAHINLVSRQDIDRLEDRHILDSLAAVPFLPSGACLDIGSGAGLPGLVFAIANPQHAHTLCERMSRRCRFLKTAVQEMALDNVEVLEGDVAAITDRRFAAITARAVASPDVIWSWAEPRLESDGAALVFASTKEDVADISYDIPCRVTYHRYHLPGIGQTHTLMQMEHQQ